MLGTLNQHAALEQSIGRSQIIVVQPGASNSYVELSAESAIEKGRRTAKSLGVSEDDKVVLLLLPHSPELFCLQIALSVGGNVPAVLPWATNRIDPVKYQLNLVHQLTRIPAARLITLPRLAENLAPSLPFPVSAISIEG